MSLEGMATPEPESADLISRPGPDLNQILERQISAGFPPELAFDLVLHELVVRAAAATQASAAALALARGSEMVCRAATGLQAPDLGVPLNTEEGLSGVCLRTRQPQLCLDAEADPRVDADAAHRLGIRSMLITPLFEESVIFGVLEVFSSKLAAFSGQHQAILETFASDCARLQRAMLEAMRRPPTVSQRVPIAPPQEPVASHKELQAPEQPPASQTAPPSPARMYDGWTLLVGALAILVAVGASFLIGSRFGWIRASLRPAQVRVPSPAPAASETSMAETPRAAPASSQSPASRTGRVAARPDELVVYDHGKVIFRMKPEPKKGSSVIAASETTRLKDAPLWLAPEEAERRLRKRIEPTYPPAAIEAHRAGDVVLEVVVGEDGSVVTERVVSGDPLLTSAALDAVRLWQYEPYRPDQHATQFHTNVTLRFSLPK
jgi:TonB family protein